MTNKYNEWSMLLLRLILGITFFAHGLQKISGFDGIAQFFGSLGLPPFLPYFVTAIETGGGLFLLLGLLTRLAAAGISAVMLGAIFTVKLDKGFIGGYESEVMLLAVAVALIISGSHMFALDNIWQKKSSAK